MILKKTLAAAATAGILTFGGAGAAFATTTTPQTGTTPQVHNRCKAADQRVDALQRLRGVVQSRIDRLNRALQYARAHHDDKLASKIESQIDKATKLRDALTDRINKIVSVCHVNLGTTSPSTGSSSPTSPGGAAGGA